MKDLDKAFANITSGMSKEELLEELKGLSEDSDVYAYIVNKARQARAIKLDGELKSTTDKKEIKKI